MTKLLRINFADIPTWPVTTNYIYSIYIQCCYNLYDNNNNLYNNLYDNNNNLYANKSSKLVIGEFWVSQITYKYGIMFKIYALTH